MNRLLVAVLVADVTEYEAGWGSRPDGYVIAKDSESMAEGRAAIDGGSYECFWRVDGRAETRLLSQENYDKLMINCPQFASKGYVWTDKIEFASL